MTHPDASPASPGVVNSWQAFDETLAEVPTPFADMPSDELDALITEAMVAVPGPEE